MDIQKIVTDLLAKLQGNTDLIAGFKKDPIATVTGLVKGLNISADDVKAIAEALGAKLKLDDAASLLGGLGSLFGKK